RSRSDATNTAALRPSATAMAPPQNANLPNRRAKEAMSVNGDNPNATIAAIAEELPTMLHTKPHIAAAVCAVPRNAASASLVYVVANSKCGIPQSPLTVIVRVLLRILDRVKPPCNLLDHLAICIGTWK